MAKKYKNSEELRIAIIVRAWKDPEFKARLIKNPRATFKEMGVDLPQEIDLRVIEDKTNTFTFVLPRSVSNAKELSEQELEKVAGGCGYLSSAYVRGVSAIAQGAEACRQLGGKGPGGE